jgi:hypothetical protein
VRTVVTAEHTPSAVDRGGPDIVASGVGSCIEATVGLVFETARQRGPPIDVDPVEAMVPRELAPGELVDRVEQLVRPQGILLVVDRTVAGKHLVL